jgi:serine/threonine protein kinase
LGGLNFPLASDESGEICQAYGVYAAAQKQALRGLFLIDPNGVLQYQVVHGLTVGRSTDEVLRVLDALQTGGLCPGEWQQGEPTFDPGRTLGPQSVIGPYRIEAVLGTGAFGTVFAAWDLMLERRVALKVVSTNGPLAAQTVLAEARAAAALNHPNVCIVYAVEPGPTPMIVMEHVDGRPLHRILEEGALAEQLALSLGRQIALAMAAAHARGIVHGDLKPANIMLTSSGIAKITDFGLARRGVLAGSDAAADNRKRGLSGTPMYMAPELTRGGSPSTAADVFALGLMLYEMSRGQAAVQGRNLAETIHQIEKLDADRCAAEVPRAFAEVVRRALAHDPQHRRITMSEIAAHLQ